MTETGVTKGQKGGGGSVMTQAHIRTLYWRCTCKAVSRVGEFGPVTFSAVRRCVTNRSTYLGLF